MDMKLSTTAAAIISVLTLSFTGNAVANDNFSQWTIRGGIANVSPDDSSSNVLSNDDGVSVDSATALGLSVTYHIDQDWGVELLAASPFSHDITGTGSLAGLAIGDTKHLPPTLSVIYKWGDNSQYHIGAGINHTVFFDSGTSDALTGALGANSTDIDLDSSTGASLKFGFDLPVSDDWSLSASVYWMDIDTKADVIVNGNVATTVDVQIDPWVYMIGLSTSF